jgi:hypothetical protein
MPLRGTPLFALTLALACSSPRSKEQVARAPAAAEDVLEQYLARAVVNASNTAPDSLFACERHGGGEPQLALAKYRIIGSEMRRDTAVVRADIIAVAQVELSAEGPYDVRQGVTRDTLSWSLVPVHDTRRWGICGYSREGADFVRVEYLGQTARWLNGASVAGIRRLADSVAAIP